MHMHSADASGRCKIIPRHIVPDMLYFANVMERIELTYHGIQSVCLLLFYSGFRLKFKKSGDMARIEDFRFPLMYFSPSFVIVIKVFIFPSINVMIIMQSISQSCCKSKKDWS